MKLHYFERLYVNSAFRNRLQRPLEFRLFNRIAPFPQQAHILSLGCGNGGELAYLAANTNPASLTGIDLDSAQIAIARQRLASLTLPVTLAVASAAKVPLPAHTYDAILCTGVLHHMPEWRHAIAESTRLLRHGGLLYVEEFHRPLLSLPLLARLFPHPAAALFTRTELAAELAHHGFTTLGTAPAPTSVLRRWLGTYISFSVVRLAITQPEYD